MFLTSDVLRLKFKAATPLIHSGCLKNSWFIDLAIPPEFCLSLLDSCTITSLSNFWPAKLIGMERQVDEQQFNHQVEAACKECMLKNEFVNGLV